MSDGVQARAGRQPRLVVRAVHDPIALVPGRVALRIVASGLGVLRLGRHRRLVLRSLDEVVFVDAIASEPILVRFAGERVRVNLVHLSAPLSPQGPTPVVSPPLPIVATESAQELDATNVPDFFIPLPELEENA
jgi:hypothetical protein